VPAGEDPNAGKATACDPTEIHDQNCAFEAALLPTDGIDIQYVDLGVSVVADVLVQRGRRHVIRGYRG